MKKSSNIIWSALVFFVFAFTSCGTTKYQELGFGGGNSSFASKQSNKVSDNQKIQNKTGNLLAAESISESESMTSEKQTSVFGKDIQQNEVKGGHQKTSKVEAMVSKFIEKRYPLINRVIPKHKLTKLISGSTSTSIEDQKSEIKKSKWPNSSSSFWKWLLTIIAVSTLAFGTILVLAGIAAGTGMYAFGDIIAGIGLGFMLIGYLILLWARNIN